MGRRSDHSRQELEQLIVDSAHRHMGEVGFAAFSARHVAREVGYSVGTIYNVFPSLDHLIVAVNTRTFVLWSEHLRGALAAAPDRRIRALVRAYFDFAAEQRHLWMAIYDHRLPPGMAMPEADAHQRATLTEIVIAEIAAVLPHGSRDRAPALARSLIATVHGHCSFALNGTFALMGEEDPFGRALERVEETLAAAGAGLPLE